MVGQTETGLPISHPPSQALGLVALLRFERAGPVALGLQLLVDCKDVVSREAPELTGLLPQSRPIDGLHPPGPLSTRAVGDSTQRRDGRRYAACGNKPGRR